MRVNDEQLAKIIGYAVDEDDVTLYSVGKDLQDARAEIERLKHDFSSYRNTAEEIHQCYIDSHMDSATFENNLRIIANSDSEWSKSARSALEKVWKRREERVKARES